MKFNLLVILSAMLMSFTSLAQTTNYSYICPVPGSKYLNPEQTIILRSPDAFDASSLNEKLVAFNGALSGTVGCKNIILSEDQKTVILEPSRSFLLGETVQVDIPRGFRTSSGQFLPGLSFSFQIKEADNRELWLNYYHSDLNDFNTVSSTPNGNYPENVLPDRSLPPSFPAPYAVQYGESNDNYIFITQNPRATSGTYKNYLTICDNYGVPIFFRKMDDASTNFMKLDDGTLAYARNLPTASEEEKFYLMDSSYVVFDSLTMGNGYFVDMHDLLLMDNGHYLMMAYDPQPVNMSLIVPGGNPNATVVGLIIQEVDNNSNVYFQWRSWDHFEITDATWDINMTGFYIDYVHGNAFEIGPDGDILLSSRHLDEITKIDYETGQVIWRFGLYSENNQFDIQNDPYGFSHQHDVRILSNGNITIYDNGNNRTPNFSQAVEYDIDEVNMVATRVWNYTHDPQIYAQMTGSYRRSWDNKNLVGWGSAWPITATEVNMDGELIFELYLPDTVVSYRALKFPWATNYFKTKSNLHFGNTTGMTGSKEMMITITNNVDQQMKINSYHHHTESFDIVTPLPIIIPANGQASMTLSFDPQEPGQYEDMLTINYDHFTLEVIERISRQIQLNGLYDDLLPTLEFDPPYGTTEVNPGTSVVISFSEPVRLANGNPITAADIPTIFKFTEENENGPGVTFMGIINDNNDQIELFPQSTLAENKVHLVRLIPYKLEDMDDNVIYYPETNMFTTGEIVSDETLEDNETLELYPSPFQDILVIRSINKVNSIKIMTINGSPVVDLHSLHTNKVTVHTEKLSPGIYIAEIELKNGEKVIRKVVRN